MIKWGKRLPARKADQGHSAVQYGAVDMGRQAVVRQRHYVRCQCGVMLSSKGDSLAAIYSYEKHAKRERAKLDN